MFGTVLYMGIYINILSKNTPLNGRAQGSASIHNNKAVKIQIQPIINMLQKVL